MNFNEISESNQYLTFTLDDEDFALEIGRVREVLDHTTITKMPGMPEFLRGVINLRGNVVPVIDLSYKLGMGSIKQSVDTCIVIVEIMIDKELIHMGAMADSVKEVIGLDQGQILPPLRLGTKLNSQFIRGMGKQDEKFLIILDIDKVLATDELERIRKAGERREADPDRPAIEAEIPPLSPEPSLADMEDRTNL